MAIYGIGTDLVKIKRIKRLMDKYNLRFAQKILTENELSIFIKHIRPEHFLAKRFAAEEAVLKALGTGFRKKIRFHDIEIKNDALGKPFLTFYGQIDNLIKSLDITQTHISLSDEEDYAMAFVIFENL